MKTLKFIHCADLHIDSPFKGVATIEPDIAKLFYESTFQSFNNIINIAIKENVDFVLIAGDIYDIEDKNLRAQLRFRDGLTRLAKEGIQSFVVYGNHDPLSSWSATLDWPEEVHRFPGNVECIPLIKNGGVIAKIYGISFATGDISKENLALRFPNAEGNVPCIGLLHANVGSNTVHAPYSPCTIEDLNSKGMDYWALGHVHTHQVLKKASPAIVYPGCSQSQNPRETGQKGCCLVTLAPGRDPDIKFIATDIVRYTQDSIDISDCAIIDDAISSITVKCQDISLKVDGCHSVIRLSLTGRTGLHTELQKGNGVEDIVERIRENFTGEKPVIWLEKLILNTGGTYDLDSLRQGKDFTADVISVCDKLQKAESPLWIELKDTLNPLFKKWAGWKYLEEPSQEELERLIEEAREQILAKLVKTE